MKAEKLQDAIGMVSEDLIEEAKTKKPKKQTWILATAAVLAIAVGITSVFWPAKNADIHLSAYAVARASYPTMAQYPDDENANWDAYELWRDGRKAQTKAYKELSVNIDDFLADSIPMFLADSNGENKVYSPVNVYMAFCMLAEITDNNSRKQILNLLGSDNIDDLRTQANALWNASYCDDGLCKSVLAASLWMNEDINFKAETVKLLAENYYASSFSGKMGSEGFNEALRYWLNDQTNGLLDEQINKIEMDPATIMALATTIYFKASWQNEFQKQNTKQDVFHAKSEDATCDFMNRTILGSYYWGDKFSAVRNDFSEGGEMYFILPDEGVIASELLDDTQVMDFILSNGDFDNQKYASIRFSVPKFDISSDINLKEGMESLGITDIFNSEVSDYSPLTDDTEKIYISKATHGARVMIDEKGCTAAAYTAILNAGSGMPTDEIDFVLDRPFIFVITSDAGIPLFVGIVNQPS